MSAKQGLRLARAERRQIGWEPLSLDDVLPEDHRAREVMSYVETMDLSGLYAAIRSVEGRAGRPAIDPVLMVAVWLYATLEDVGSARQLERLCESDRAYRWIMGGVAVSHKTLSEFRVEAGPVLDELLRRSIAGLALAGTVDLSCLAVDGMRLRANAGAKSFRRAERLEELRQQAEAKVAALKNEVSSDPGSSDRRTQARRKRAAEERLRRVKEALAAAEEIRQQREREAKEQRRKDVANKSAPRGSTTDPEARKMKMPDNGYRPAFNVQVTTTVGGDVVVGVKVLNNGSDRGQLEPAMQEIESRYGGLPEQVLADGGYDSKADIEQVHALQEPPVEVFCPRTIDKKTGELKPPLKGDGPGTHAWHERMSTQAGKDRYKDRFMSERIHADWRNRGLIRVLVRGMVKVKAVVLWHAHAFNFLSIKRLARA